MLNISVAGNRIVSDPDSITGEHGTTGPDPTTKFFAAGKKQVELPSVEIKIKVTDRDDPKKKWADSVIKTGPVYSGKSTGDMVSWKISGPDSWANATYTWSAEGPETKFGPNGVGKNEWKIADGDEDAVKDWLDWKPVGNGVRRQKRNELPHKLPFVIRF